MGKGIRDKQTGFWMYMQQFVKPELEQKFGRRLSATDLVQFGLPHWSKLSFEEKEEWREKAKEYNRSDERQNRRLLNCEYHQRRHEADQPEDSAQSYRSRKLKPSKIVPPSRRYDEVDQYTRKYFAGVDDFEVKRENDRREFIDRYQWKFAGKDLASKKEFFHESEIILATVNVYYEDNLNEQMIPSEISILKCSIKRGIYDHRHYILGFAKNGILCKNYEAEAEKNEQMTGLLMDCDKMPANVRFDYAQIWNEIKAFTRIDGDSVKLLLPSKSWNAVVGSFDALFVYANEKSFSRIESRFATMEDYFMAVYTTVHDIPVNDEIKSDVVIEMNEVWHCALFFDSMACDFHAGLKSTKHSQARNCSLFTAHKTAFSFFTLCNKHVFLACELTERHILNEGLLSTAENLTGDDSDAELFCDASIPCSSLYGKGYLTQKPQKLIPRVSESYQNDWFLKTTNKVKQTSASPCKEMGATHNIESVPKPCNSQPVSTCNYGPVCVKSGQMFSKVKQNRSISSKGSMECDLNLSSYPLKTCKSPSSSENLIPERTSGGFCIPSIYQTNSSCGRKNRPTTSASYGETGSEQKNTSQKSEMVANRMITRRNPHCSDQSLARHQQKEKEAEVTTGKSQHQSFSCFTQPLFANTTEEYRRTIQNADIMKPFTLEPLICEKAETFGWSENARCVPDEKFTRWLNSAYFEISGSNTESDYRKTR
uniref:HMG box domain-containing protein n=1 Tax=Elaeophora elaphi TaxID=1147741 RepID=A0A0R3RGG3_9BILA